MDGMAHTAAISGPISISSGGWMQRTLASAISCTGVGLHSGRRVTLTLRPAPPEHGIVFRRVDLDGMNDIPARHDHVSDTRLCTVLSAAGRPALRVGTVEHVMAALAGCDVHNVLIEVDGAEVPILDGSAGCFVFLIDCAGIVEQDAPLARIEVLRTVRVEQNGAFAELRPSSFGFDMALSIDFPARAIGHQSLTLHLSPENFRSELAQARTFTMVQEVKALQSAGLALGGSLDNAIVVDDAEVLNPTGLRMQDEFVRHKLLDAVGDLALAGAALNARLVANRTGHDLNNRLLRALFADDANWRLVTPDMDLHPVWHTQAIAAAA